MSHHVLVPPLALRQVRSQNREHNPERQQPIQRQQSPDARNKGDTVNRIAPKCARSPRMRRPAHSKATHLPCIAAQASRARIRDNRRSSTTASRANKKRRLVEVRLPCNVGTIHSPRSSISRGSCALAALVGLEKMKRHARIQQRGGEHKRIANGRQLSGSSGGTAPGKSNCVQAIGTSQADCSAARGGLRFRRFRPARLCSIQTLAASVPWFGTPNCHIE